MRAAARHQVKAMNFIDRMGGCAGVFMAPGTGKTLVAIRWAKNRGHNRYMVVCRKDDFMTWVDELKAEGWTEEAMVLIDTKNLNFDHLHDRFHTNFRCVVMVTYDRIKSPPIAKFLRTLPFTLVIADEAHYIKRFQSTRTQTVIAETRRIKHRLALTGSPITNHPDDLFSLGYFIDNGKTFGDNPWKFKHSHYLRSGKGWYKRRTAKALLAKKLARIAFHVHEDDVLTLPPIRNAVEHCRMSGVQRRHYEKVLNEWEVELRSGESVEIDHVIVYVSKLRQLAAGFIYNPDHSATWFKSGKIAKLMDMLGDDDYLGTKPKIVVWCAHTAEILKIGEELDNQGIQHVLFYGTDRRRKERARKDFRDNPKVRLFVGQVDSGVGMNELVVADTAVYFSNSQRVVSRQQSKRRIRRRGSERHKVITYYDLVTDKSIDRHLLKEVGKKMDFATAVLNKIKAGVPVRQLVT